MSTIHMPIAESLHSRADKSLDTHQAESMSIVPEQEVSIIDILRDAKKQALLMKEYAFGPKSLEEFDAEMRSAKKSDNLHANDIVG